MINCISRENPDIIYIDGYYYKIPRHFKRKMETFVYDNEPTPINEREKLNQKPSFLFTMQVLQKYLIIC